MYKQFLSSRSNDKVKYIKNIQKLVNATIKNCQKQYYDALLTKNKSNIKATCSMNRAKCKFIYILSIKEHGVTIIDSEEIANRFCQYFANVGPNLVSKIIPVLNLLMNI